MESQSILIKDAIIIGREIKKSSLLIENQEIAQLDDKIDLNDADQVIDGQGKVLIPGLVNTHTHLSMTLMRGLADDLPLDTWLNQHIWPVEANLEGEHCYAGALLACLEMIKSGTTTCNDMYFFMDQVAQAVDEAGIRGVLSHGMIDLADEDKRKKEIKETQSIIKKCHNTAEGRIKVSLGPHAPYTCSEELLTWVRHKAQAENLKIHIHVSETKNEVQSLWELKGKRPFEYLDDLGLLGPNLLAAHAVWLSDTEINLIKDRKVNLSHNPVSNMKLASGIMPLAELIEKNICVSLGTDGAASNNNLDLFGEMKTAALLQKVYKMDPTVLPADKILEMATSRGATALGLEEDIGTLEVGKKADMILMDIKAPHLTPYRHPISHMVYSAKGSDVSTVICNGKILMQEKEVLVLNEGEVMDIAENAAEDLLSKA